MKNLFSSPPASSTPPPAGLPGGWNGLSSGAKLGILGGVAALATGALLWPSWNNAPAPPPQVMRPGGAAPIRDFEAAPPPPGAPSVEEVVNRVMGDTPKVVIRARPVPTEMALYIAPKPTGTATAVTPAAATAAAKPEDGPATNHGTLVRHPDFLIRAGDVIPCLPVGHQNSEKPGLETCQIPVWFRSTNQQRGLLPPHSRMFGQMRTGMQSGEQRIGVSYTLIQTPNFNMPIEAQAGDALGASGMDKIDVNTFFWNKAGAVALYALMDATIGIGQNAASAALNRSMNNGNNGNTTNLNFSGPSQSLAAREFDAIASRPPLGTRPPALPITVTINADLDFYDICMQAMRVDPMACPRQ